MTAADTSTVASLVTAVRVVADATPNPCEGSRGHLRQDFAWQAEEDLRRLNAGEDVGFPEDALRRDCLSALARWAAEDQR